MEERKTAAIILLVLAFIFLFFTVILPYVDRKRVHSLSFKTCKVDFKYRHYVDTTDDWYIIAQNDLGLCLCKVYTKKQDTATAREIMKIYKHYGNPISLDKVENFRDNNFDSILKYKTKAFNYIPDD